nr:aminopeptidase P family N-terminal domain-containing protein [Corynebacterium lactis]
MSDFAARRAAATAAFDDYDIDGFLTVDSAHVAWLSGFAGSNAGLMLSASGALLSTDGRYTVQAGKQAPDLELVSARNTGVALLGRAEALGVSRLGVESELLTMAAFADLESNLPGGLELVASRASSQSSAW